MEELIRNFLIMICIKWSLIATIMNSSDSEYSLLAVLLIGLDYIISLFKFDFKYKLILNTVFIIISVISTIFSEKGIVYLSLIFLIIAIIFENRRFEIVKKEY